MGDSAWLSVRETERYLAGASSPRALVRCSFTGSEARCQSSVCEGEQGRTEHRSATECAMALCMEWGREGSICGAYIMHGAQHISRGTLGAWSRLRRSLENLNPPDDVRGSHSEAERCDRGKPSGVGGGVLTIQKGGGKSVSTGRNAHGVVQWVLLEVMGSWCCYELCPFGYPTEEHSSRAEAEPERAPAAHLNITATRAGVRMTQAARRNLGSTWPGCSAGIRVSVYPQSRVFRDWALTPLRAKAWGGWQRAPGPRLYLSQAS